MTDVCGACHDPDWRSPASHALPGHWGNENRVSLTRKPLQNAAKRPSQEGLYTSGTSNPSQRDVDRATKEMESCMGKCADQFKGALPAMEKRIFSQFQ